MALAATTSAQAEVEILYFPGEYQDDVVLLEWETGIGMDLLGFFVTRSNEQFGTYSGKIQVITDPAHTPTPTQAFAPTSSPTATISSSSEPTVPTRTPTPAATHLSTLITATAAQTASFTPTGTSTLEATGVISATTTLIPLPEITLQFPTPVTNLDASSEGAAKTQGESPEDQRKDIWRAIRRAFLLGFIVLIWLVLAVWFYLASRRIE